VVVVKVAEAVKLGLEVGQGGGGGLSGQPAFLGLVESFDLALGLRVVRRAILLGDVQGGQEVFEGVLPAAEPRGVDAAVVGQGRGGEPVLVAGGQEGLHDSITGDGRVGGAAQEVSGVVVEPVEDLRVGAVGQAPVGEVRLPALVGLGCLEASVGGAGAFAGFGLDQAGGVQDASDGGGRRCGVTAFGQVPGDREGAGVEAVTDQLQSQFDDELADHGGGRSRV
jgi:hypothetical protein